MSPGGNSLERLNPDEVSIKDMPRTSSSVVVVPKSIWDVGWRSSAQYFKHYLRLGKLTDVVVDEGETGRALQTIEETKFETVVEETDRHRSREYTGCVLPLNALAWAVVLIGWLDGMAQALEAKRDSDRSISYEDSSRCRRALRFIRLYKLRLGPYRRRRDRETYLDVTSSF